MRVLIVIDALSFGGAENVLVTLAGQAPRAGLDLDVVVIAPPTEGRAQWLPALRRAGLEPRFLHIHRLAQPTAVAKVAAAVRASRCDVVHAHLGTASTLAPVAARLVGSPAVCTLHHVPGTLRGREALRERLSVGVASRSGGLIFVSWAALRGFAARYRARPESWTVIYNGVDLDRFHPARPGPPPPLPAGLGVPAGVPVVTVIGHLRPGKGQDVAIAAWPEVLRADHEARLLLVGDGPERPRLAHLVGRLGLAGRIVFAGVSHDVAAILRGSTVVALPTRTEALPTVLIEAAACGVPAVATRVGGVPEVVVEGQTGWLVDAPQPALFAAALRTALTEPGRRTEMGRRARLVAERRFDAVQWADRLRRLYAAVAAGGRAGTAGVGNGT